jgi:hypothetical protein
MIDRASAILSLLVCVGCPPSPAVPPSDPGRPRADVPVRPTPTERGTSPPGRAAATVEPCTDGDAAACVAAARRAGGAGRPDEALEFVERACSLAGQGLAEHPAACRHHAYGVADRWTDALVAFCDDCGDGVAAACGLEPLAAAVLASADGACGEGAAEACVRAGAFRRAGCGTEVDPLRAVEDFARACTGAGGPGCPGLEALYADPNVLREIAPVPPCVADSDRPDVSSSGDGFLESTGFPAVSRDRTRVAVYRARSDLAANESAWIEILDVRDGTVLETWALLEVEDAPEGEWPEPGSPALRRIRARLDTARRRLDRRGFRSLAPMAVPGDAARCGPVIATGEAGGERRRIVVRDPGPGTVWWARVVEGSVGSPGCGPDEGAAMLQGVSGWFDPEGNLLVVERSYVAGPDWCDGVLETDVARRPTR